MILGGIRRELAGPLVAEEFERRVRAQLRELSKPRPQNRGRMVVLEAQIENLLDVMASQGLRTSTSLTELLKKAEAELVTLKADHAATDVTIVEKLLSQLAEHFKRQLDELPQVLTEDVARARTTLATHIGPLTVQADEQDIRFFREAGHVVATLLRTATGGRGASNFGRGERI